MNNILLTASTNFSVPSNESMPDHNNFLREPLTKFLLHPARREFHRPLEIADCNVNEGN